MNLLDLPLELVYAILSPLVGSLGYKRSLRLRVVCRQSPSKFSSLAKINAQR